MNHHRLHDIADNKRHGSASPKLLDPWGYRIPRIVFNSASTPPRWRARAFSIATNRRRRHASSAHHADHADILGGHSGRVKECRGV